MNYEGTDAMAKQLLRADEMVGKTVRGTIEDGANFIVVFNDDTFVVVDAACDDCGSESVAAGITAMPINVARSRYRLDEFIKLGLTTEDGFKQAVERERIMLKERAEAYERSEYARLKAKYETQQTA